MYMIITIEHLKEMCLIPQLNRFLFTIISCEITSIKLVQVQWRTHSVNYKNFLNCVLAMNLLKRIFIGKIK